MDSKSVTRKGVRVQVPSPAQPAVYKTIHSSNNLAVYHYVYCTENILNGKIYVGKHSTNRLDDGYLGSGSALTKAFSKHGVENFCKRILTFAETAEEALVIEADIVDEEFVANPHTYNLVLGGRGSIERGYSGSKRSRASSLRSKYAWLDPEFRKRKSIRMAEFNRRRWIEGKFTPPNWIGRKHHDSTKAAIGEKNSVHQTGSGNSMFGTVWIHNTLQHLSKRVPADQLPAWSSQGWTKGRKMGWKSS